MKVTAIYCDRCNKQIPTGPLDPKPSYLGIDRFYKTSSIEICNDCYGSFQAWYQEKGQILPWGA